MRHLLAACLFAITSAVVAAQSPIKVGSLNIAPATKVAEIDTDKVDKQPSRLAWSPDGAELYVQMLDGQFGRPPSKLSHLIFKAENGDRREVKAESEWVTSYWTVKSGQASPDTPAFKIELKQEARKEKTVSAPMGGDLARGGVGGDGGTASVGDALASAYGQQTVKVISMILHDQVIGEYINAPIVPGQTFGWGPKGSRVIAYSQPRSGRIIVMDEQGTRQEIDGTKDSLFPAWSPDGNHLAWLQKDGRKKYVLQVARVARN